MGNVVRIALAISAAALLGGCGGGQLQAGPPGALSRGGVRFTYGFDSRYGYTILHIFAAGNDGAFPASGLTPVNDKLYGTAYSGGGGGCDGIGCGVIFKTSLSGKTTVVHEFDQASRANSAGPMATLLLYRGNLYGTTLGIGYAQYGTVFRFSPGGSFKILYTFGDYADGSTGTPVTALGNKLYGTTPSTVYKLSPAGGHERTVHTFEGKQIRPVSGLLPFRGVLFGESDKGKHGAGTIYKITPAGSVTILYNFKGKPDGSGPTGGLLLYHDKLYGTTVSGGTDDVGTVFEFDPVSQHERVIYSFTGGYFNPSDGADPEAGLIELNDKFYGTTKFGGIVGAGTIFDVGTTGRESVLHYFGFGSYDGEDPEAPLADVNGKLYGTAFLAGGGPCGCGIVFRIHP